MFRNHRGINEIDSPSVPTPLARYHLLATAMLIGPLNYLGTGKCCRFPPSLHKLATIMCIGPLNLQGRKETLMLPTPPPSPASFT